MRRLSVFSYHTVNQSVLSLFLIAQLKTPWQRLRRDRKELPKWEDTVVSAWGIFKIPVSCVCLCVSVCERRVLNVWALWPVYTSRDVDIPLNICHFSQKNVQKECFCSEMWTSAQVTLPLTAPLFRPISLPLSQPPLSLLSFRTLRCIKRVDWGSHVLRAHCGLALDQIHTHQCPLRLTHTLAHKRCDKVFLKAWSLSDSTCLHTPAFTSQSEEVYKHTLLSPFRYVFMILDPYILYKREKWIERYMTYIFTLSILSIVYICLSHTHTQTHALCFPAVCQGSDMWCGVDGWNIWLLGTGCRLADGNPCG